MLRILIIVLVCFFNVSKAEVLSDTTKNLNKIISRFVLPTDTVADIGVGDMIRTATLISYNPGSFFYLQDIDSAICNSKKLDAIAAKYKVTLDPQKIAFVVGDIHDTKLKSKSCNKILLTYMLHEVDLRIELLENLKTKLKDGGELLISETITTKPQMIVKGCNKRFMTNDEFYALLKSAHITIIEEINYLSNKKGKRILLRCKFEN